MRPTKLEYDRYLALVQFGRATGWDHARIAAENPFRVADVGMSLILLRQPKRPSYGLAMLPVAAAV